MMRSLATPALLLLLPLAALAQAVPHSFKVTSLDFAENTLIPARFTCAGENISPELEIHAVPPGARSLAIIVEDPDAPSGIFTHWVLWNISPDTTKIDRGSAPAGAIQGANDFGKPGYSGPCPPSGTHRYLFHVMALNASLKLSKGASRTELDAALRDHVLATATLLGIFAKTPRSFF
jgi:hypothetical protein